MENQFEFDREINKWKFILVLPLDGDHPKMDEVKQGLSKIIDGLDDDAEAYFTHIDEKELSVREK